MAGPFPADQTPARAGGKPIHNFRHAFAVAIPTPAGNPRNHHRNRHASDRAKRRGCPPLANKAWAVMHMCSVSSLTIPRFITVDGAMAARQKSAQHGGATIPPATDQSRRRRLFQSSSREDDCRELRLQQCSSFIPACDQFDFATIIKLHPHLSVRHAQRN